MKKAILLFCIFYSSFDRLSFSCGSITNAQGYFLYGEASLGGRYGDGVIFRFDPFTQMDTVIFNFNGINGNTPIQALYLAQNGIMYGVCEFGGINNDGVIFSYNLSTGIENTIIGFIGSNGANSGSEITPASFGFLYGTAGNGGQYDGGVIFRYNPNSNQDTVLFNFNDTDGTIPYGGLFPLNDSSFYGMTSEGGLYNSGVIYQFNPSTDKETVLFNFNSSTDGENAQGAFIKDSNGLLYGMTAFLGTGGGGYLISFDPLTGIETDLISFDSGRGLYPYGCLFLATDSLLYGMTAEGGTNNDGVLFSYNVNTSTYSVVVNFDSINGSFGGDALIEDTINKILYGMTMYGGTYNNGVIFSYNLITRRDSVLLNFDGTNGANPFGTLLLVPDTLVTGAGKISSKKGEAVVYPNPNNGIFTIALSHAELVSASQPNIEIYNVLGERIYFETLKQVQGDNLINLSNESSGIYLYRVSSLNGNLLGTGKFIIQ